MTEPIFRAKRLNHRYGGNRSLTKGRTYDIYKERNIYYYTIGDNGIKYVISRNETLNESWEIIHSEEDKFREVLLSEGTI